MKSAALQYARSGWHIFPVQLTPVSEIKTEHQPLVGDWPKFATSDEKIVEAWWTEWPEASIGAIPASAGLLAVDYDTKSGRSVAEIREALTNALGIDLPDTGLVAQSRTGGQHHYYRVDEPVSCSNGKFAKGADIRSAKNGYIILPPSMNGRYKWLKSGQPADMPAEICTKLGKMGEDAGEKPAWEVEPDQEANIALAREWLEKEARPSVEGEGGNQALYDTAAMMVSFAVSEAMALELLTEVYNPAKCHPPWEAGDLARTISNAYRYHTSAPGNMTPGYRTAKLGFAPVAPRKVVSDSPELGTQYFRITDRDTIVDLPPPQWLVEPYLQEGTCAILTGGYGSFKSFIALDLALSVATGSLASIWSLHGAGPSVYMLGEGRAGMGKRLAAWEKHNGVVVPRNDILFVDPVPHVSMDKSIRSELTKALLDVGDGYKFVVLDTVGRAIAGLKENDSAPMSMLSMMASDIRDELGACVLLVGHTKKDGATGRGATRGSGVLENDADTILNVERTGAQSVSIEVVKQKDAPEADSIDLALKEVRLSLEDSSLVVVKGKRMTNSVNSQAELEGDVYHVIDQVACEVIASDPHSQWSTRNLAENVARDGRVPIGVEAVRRKLKDISVRPHFQVSKMYLPGHGQKPGKWKYAPIN